MEDEKIEQEAQAEITSKNAVEERMKNLSKDKIEAETKAKEAEEKAALAQKEAGFYKDFSGSISKYPAANEYQDAIKEKVMSGYTVEDATVSVLAKEGKLGTVQAPPPPRQSPAGGSAPTQIQQGGAKTVAEMTRDERRKALDESFIWT
jgi:hypothetical protein